MISMAVFLVLLSILIYIIISINQENKKREILVDSQRISYIIGNKIKSASIARDTFIYKNSSENNNYKYIILAKSDNKSMDIVRFHLYKGNNEDTNYYIEYIKNNEKRTVKYKIPKYVQYRVDGDNLFYQISFFVYEKDSKTNSKKLAYYILLPKKN